LLDFDFFGLVFLLVSGFNISESESEYFLADFALEFFFFGLALGFVSSSSSIISTTTSLFSLSFSVLSILRLDFLVLTVGLV
jgi:hypothetical protein